MADVNLNAVKAGITRLRTKGGANAESLYDLANAYVTSARTLAPRPGSKWSARIPEGTVGLALHNGVFQVFSDRAIPGIPEGYSLNVLSHPDRNATPAPELVRIWKAEPLLGGLYVVAEWSDDEDRGIHYWLQSVSAPAWEPGTIHMLGAHVVPTVANGISYVANRLNDPDPVWEPDVERTLNVTREPSSFNGYKYVVVEVHGDPARSGSEEPDWIAEDGAIVIEEADVAPNIPPPQQPPPQQPPPGYGNPGGGWGIGGDHRYWQQH